jgi:hypothetical protein
LALEMMLSASEDATTITAGVHRSAIQAFTLCSGADMRRFVGTHTLM